MPILERKNMADHLLFIFKKAERMSSSARTFCAAGNHGRRDAESLAKLLILGYLFQD